MSVPLRKDELETAELTTADLAQGKRPAASEDRPAADSLKTDLLKEDLAKEDRPRPVLAARPSIQGAQDFGSDMRENTSERKNEVRNEARNETRNAAEPQNAANTTPLFPNNELDELRNRWSGVQTAFVDEPRRAVEQADSLVASAMKRLAEVFADERAKLEKQWDRGDDVSTEDLRIALQRYRSFFQRLLAI
jgi:hypothetical protein